MQQSLMSAASTELGAPKPRLDYLDVAKGIAIIAMMMGHWHLKQVNVLVCGFHMQLFFFISGYTFHPKPWKQTLRDKSARLLLPYAAVCATKVGLFALKFLLKAILPRYSAEAVRDAGRDVLAHLFTSVCGAGGYNNHLLNTSYTFKSVGPVWFLPALFFVILFLRALDKRPFALFYVILIAYTGYKMQSICILPMFFLSSMTALMFAYAGQQAAGYFDGKTPWITLGISVVLYGFCLWHFQGRIIEVVGNRYPDGVQDILQSFAGVTIVLCLSKGIARYTKRINSLLCFFGRNTLCVLYMHTIEKVFFPWHLIDALFPKTGLWWIPLLLVKTVMQLCFSAIVIFAVSKIPFMARIFRPVTKQKPKKLAA